MNLWWERYLTSELCQIKCIIKHSHLEKCCIAMSFSNCGIEWNSTSYIPFCFGIVAHWNHMNNMYQGNKGVKVPDGPNHCREPFTSAGIDYSADAFTFAIIIELSQVDCILWFSCGPKDQSLIQSLTEGISAKKSDTCGSHDNQLHSTSSDTLSSSASVHGLHNSERPVSVNGPAMVHGGHIFPNQNNSSLHLNPAPCQGSVTKDQTMSNDQTVAHVKQKLTDQSFDQVRKPCPVVRQDVSNLPMEQRNGNPRRSDDDLLKQSSEMVLSAPTTHANFASPSVKTQLDSSTMVSILPKT